MKDEKRNVASRWFGQITIVAAAAVLFGVAAQPCVAQPLLAEHKAWATHGFDGDSVANWSTPTSADPIRLEFSDSRTFDLVNYSRPPYNEPYQNSVSMSGFLETFNGVLPKIQFMIENSATGPHNLALGGSGTPSQKVTGGLEYYIAVTANPGAPYFAPTDVPIKITAHGGVDASAAGSGYALAIANAVYSWNRSGVTGILDSAIWTEENTGGTDSGPHQSPFVNSHITLPRDAMLQINMSAWGTVQSSVSNYTGESGSAQATGFVDPIVVIDPTWEYANQYHLEYSPGIEQYVPEPASGALFTLGFFLMRRRRS